MLVTHAPEVAEQFDRIERLETINRRESAAKVAATSEVSSPAAKPE